MNEPFVRCYLCNGEGTSRFKGVLVLCRACNGTTMLLEENEPGPPEGSEGYNLGFQDAMSGVKAQDESKEYMRGYLDCLQYGHKARP